MGFMVKILPHSVARDTVQLFLQQHQPDGSKAKVSSSLVKEINSFIGGNRAFFKTFIMFFPGRFLCYLFW